MKSFYLVSALLALAGSTLADNCNPGLLYCGHSLLGKGNYQPQIDQCVFDNHVIPVDNGQSILYACVGGPNGVIQYITQCIGGRCRDNGDGKSDSCF